MRKTAGGEVRSLSTGVENDFGLARTIRLQLRTAQLAVKWQPWTAASSLLGLISMA